MGKKARKTRWRTLAIETGNQSDSEESSHDAVHSNKNYYHNQHYNNSYYNNNNHTNGGGGHYTNGYQHHYGGVQRSYRSKYSSAAYPPRGRFGSNYSSHHQHHQGNQPQYHQQLSNDSNSKSSSTTTSSTTTNVDGKITFNEDEYTRITTPRQDVLFKKGYLNKPKTYQTQTSTGNSTISTGNSTGNGTPDHQSTEGTDLEYESQFVFPNGFVDHNGIYYINGYESYPQLVVYNPTLCYPEYMPSPRSKRLSTGSLTESTSPHNEETSQDLSHSGGETVSYPEYDGNQVYNVVFPGYFYSNGMPAEMEIGHGEPRKIKKRRRRKLSKPVMDDNWSTSSEDEYDDSEEMVSEIENRIIQGTHRPPSVDSPPTPTITNETEDGNGPEDMQNEPDTATASATSSPPSEAGSTKMTLKADAKEFIPRSYIPHHHHLHHMHHPHHHGRHHQMSPPFIANLIPLPPPFLPVPPMHIAPAPLAPHTPQNDVQPLYVDEATTTSETVIPPSVTTLQEDTPLPIEQAIPAAYASSINEVVATEPEMPATKPAASSDVKVVEATVDETKLTSISAEKNNKNIDIAKIVSKLEEAAKEQRAKNQKPQQRSKRTYTRPLAVTLNVDTKKNSIKIDTTKVSTVSTAGGKNYAQMLRNKGGYAMANPSSPQRSQYPRLVEITGPASGTAATTTPLSPGHQSNQKPKIPGQWISVQSRKKRKNKAQESDWDDVEDSKETNVVAIKEESPDDGFEKYDVSKLEDVVIVEDTEEVAATVVADEGQDSQNNKPIDKQVPESVPVEVMQPPQTTKTSEDEEFEKLIKTLEQLEAKTPKKKSSQKVNNKRVIITDNVVMDDVAQENNKKTVVKKNTKPKIAKVKVKESRDAPDLKENKQVKAEKEADTLVVESPSISAQLDLSTAMVSTSSSEAVEDQEVSTNDTETKEEKIPEEAIKTTVECTNKVVVVVDPVTTASSTDEEKKVVEDLKIPPTTSVDDSQKLDSDTPEKKRKKKKKSSAKKIISSEPSTPSTITTSVTSLGEETSYDFLLTDTLLLEDERTNIEVSEELDKIIQRGIYSSLEEKIKSLNITAGNDGFFKSMTSLVASTVVKKPKEDDLTSTLTKTTNIFKPKRTLGQNPIEPTTTGSFLDIANIQVDPGISPSHLHGSTMEEYPIMRAVKDWMVRTRETTPEVELLKSPKTILRELNGTAVVADNIKEDVEVVETIKESWSLTPESSFDDDLLECWDDLEDTTKVLSTTTVSNGLKDNAIQGTEPKQEVLEVYESMYGKNEDFNKIKAEIEERKRKGTLPSHGHLPYRAICCSLM